MHLLPWQTLAPVVPQHWEQVLREVIDDLDPEIYGKLEELGSMEGLHGKCEVCRIIYHVLKDRMKGEGRSNGWLKKTCDEAFQALRNKPAWAGTTYCKSQANPRVPQRQEVQQAHRGYTGPQGSSSSSTTWTQGYQGYR